MTAEHGYHRDIDRLRAIAVLAVLAVVVHHLSGPLLPGGYVGVDVFFVISGFLITTEPIAWMGAETCQLTDNGKSLYRDSHHLSEAGALAFQRQLTAGLDAASGAVPRAGLDAR